MQIVSGLCCVALMSAILPGCSSVPMQGYQPDGRYCFQISKKRLCTIESVPGLDQEVSAKQFVNLPGQQIVWIVRNGRLDSLGRVEVNVNGIHVDMLPNTVSRYALAPGQYQVIAGQMSRNIDELESEGKAGEQAYIEVYADVGFFTTRFSLRRIPEDEGRRKVLASKLIKDASSSLNP